MPEKKIVKIGDVAFGEPGTICVIAGPCVIENEELTRKCADKVKEATEKCGIGGVFKASYDKANRSSGKSPRGPGIEKGLEILDLVRRETGLPVISDVHSSEEAERASHVLDALQIPAFLCRQTDLLHAAGVTGKPVNVKKGQFMAPEDMRNVVGKLEEVNCRQILLTERGTSFGYHNLVSDMRSLVKMRESGYPVIYDATHSVQSPGGLGESSGGDRSMVPHLARAAAAVGVDAFFIECHPKPDEALSDGPNMMDIEDLDSLLASLRAIDSARLGVQ
ncbi:MAG: 3-deoxy-8-phosphooctulonate synthase [Nitrospinae bacterium]|nr:3-deoxy-8-phosphooctulonate synthase [Nitrospinota bacterium]